MKREINSLGEISLDTIDWTDLKKRHGTFRVVSKGSGRDKKTSGRVGVQTVIGDIEESVWIAAVKHMVNAKGEEWLLDALQQWYLDNAAWCKGNPAEAQVEALEALASKLFDRTEWVGYEAFNAQYRPHIMSGSA